MKDLAATTERAREIMAAREEAANNARRAAVTNATRPSRPAAVPPADEVHIGTRRAETFPPATAPPVRPPPVALKPEPVVPDEPGPAWEPDSGEIAQLAKKALISGYPALFAGGQRFAAACVSESSDHNE